MSSLANFVAHYKPINMYYNMILTLSLSLLLWSCQASDSNKTEPTTTRSADAGPAKTYEAGVNLSPLNDEGPVKWSFGVKSLGNDTYELVFQADIDKGWYVYSQFLESADGPVATSFNFESKNVQLDGKCAEEGDKVEGFDEIFAMNISKFKNRAIFRQKAKITDKSQPVTGYLTFMTCDNEKCLPPQDIEFSITVQ